MSFVRIALLLALVAVAFNSVEASRRRSRTTAAPCPKAKCDCKKSEYVKWYNDDNDCRVCKCKALPETTTEAPATTKAARRRSRRSSKTPKPEVNVRDYLKRDDIACDFSAFWQLVKDYDVLNAITAPEVTVFAPKTSALKPLRKTLKKLAKQEADPKPIRDFLKGHIIKENVVQLEEYEGKKVEAQNGQAIHIQKDSKIKSTGVTVKAGHQWKADNGVLYCINGFFGQLKQAINRRRGDGRRARRSATTAGPVVDTTAEDTTVATTAADTTTTTSTSFTDTAETTTVAETTDGVPDERRRRRRRRRN